MHDLIFGALGVVFLVVGILSAIGKYFEIQARKKEIEMFKRFSEARKMEFKI